MADGEERTPRELETRDNTTRKESWQPPAILPDPTPQEGWVFRWVRTSMMGHEDNRHVSMRFREGWQPVKAVDHPELMVIPDHGTRFEGNVEVGGLLLCKAPVEQVEAAREYNQRNSTQQMQAVDNSYMKDNDPRMPKLQSERNTKVTFGRGNS